MSKESEFLKACKEGDFTLANELLQQGCNPDDVKEDETLASPLHYACQQGNLSFVKTLVETYKCNVDSEDKTKRTPLHYAAQNGCKEVAQYLMIERNCKPEPIDNNGDSPLHLACREGHNKLVSALSKKCNPKLKNKDGYTPLQLAANREISILFRQHSEKIFAEAGIASKSASTGAPTGPSDERQASSLPEASFQDPRATERGAESTHGIRQDSAGYASLSQRGQSSQRLQSSAQDSAATAMDVSGIDAESLRLIQQLTSQLSLDPPGGTGASYEGGASLFQSSDEYDEPPDDLELLVTRVKSGDTEMGQDEYLLLKSAVASALSTPPDALYLAKLSLSKEGVNSVELVHWFVSNSLMDRSIHISPTNEENLKQHNVADIVYKGKCVFFNPTHYFEGGSPGANGGIGSFRIKYISSDHDFDSEMGTAGDKPTVVEFTADWCPPSLYIAPHFAKLSVDYPELLFLSVDADLCRKAISDYGVRSYPSFQFMKEGYSSAELNFSGYNVEKLYSRVDTWNREHANFSVADAQQSAATVNPPDDLERIVARIKVDDTTESDGYESVKNAVAAALKTSSSSLYLLKPGILPTKEGSSDVNIVHWGISRSIMDQAQITPEAEEHLKKHNVADIVYQGKCFFLNPMFYFGKSSMADVGTFGLKYITSDEDFKKALRDAGDDPVIVEFTAHWCPPSLYIAPYFVKLSVDYPEILFLSVDVDQCDYSSLEFGVDGVPAFHFIKGGHSFSDLSFSGYSVDKLTAGVEKWNLTNSTYVVPTKIKRTVTVWENGFTVDNGPLRTLGHTTSDEKFLLALYNGQTPQELVDAAYGGIVDLDIQNKRDEPYVKPKVKPFTGEGHTLGGPACSKFDQDCKEQLSTVGPPSLQLQDPSLAAGEGYTLGGSGCSKYDQDCKEQLSTIGRPPSLQDPSSLAAPKQTDSKEGRTTNVRIRLARGTSLCAKFKDTQTVQDVRDFIDRNSDAPSDPDMSYILITTAPRRQYHVDPNQTLADADLCNACITQKTIPKPEMDNLLATGWTTDNVAPGTSKASVTASAPPECDNPAALKTISICKQKLDCDFFSNPSALPVVSQYYYSAERVAHVPFIGPVAIVTCDHRGREFKNKEHDITVSIPEGAIPQGLTVHFELAVAIIGPFNFTGSRRPISPILWMCPQETFEFQKPFTITLPHFLTEATTEDLESVVFSKATEYCYYTAPDGERLYNFRTHPDLKRPHFFSEGGVNYGSFETSHCCLYCLESKEWTREDMLKAGYFLHVVNAPRAVYFYVTFYLSSCVKAIKEKYSKQKHFRVQNPIRIELQPQIDGSDIGPHIQITLDGLANSIITQIPESGIIKASSVDFWECSKSLLKKHQETDHYPPKVELQLKEFTPQLCIKGCSEEKDVLSNIRPHLKFSLESFSSPDLRQTGWIPNPLHYQPQSDEKVSDACENEDIDVTSTLSTINDTPLDGDDDWDDVVDALEELNGDWKTVGRKLHIKNAKIKELESNYPKDCSTCLSEVAHEWLEGNYNVKRFGEPSWRLLAQAISSLNMKVFKFIAEKYCYSFH